MKINLLHLFLVLIALQSTLAVADLHQSHQSGKDHLSFDHNEHSTDVLDTHLKSLSGDLVDSDLSYDCHHCCHCHAVACYYLDSLQNDYISFFGSSNLNENLAQFTSRSTSPNLRPPIV